MTDYRLKAAVIGLGVGEQHIHGYNADPRCKTALLCDFDPSHLKAVGALHTECRLTTDPQMVFSDETIDVVSIASYDTYHYQQVIEALRNKKHVFVEKPLCLFEDELKNIVTALNASTNLALSSNLILRKSPRFIELREHVQNHALGDIYYLEGDYNYGRLPKLTEGWRGTEPYYSVFHGGAIHLIDLLTWITGKTVVNVFAMGNNISTRGSVFQHNDLVTALLKFNDGAIAKVTANFSSVTPHHHKLCIYGTTGTFEQSHSGAGYLFDRKPATTVEFTQAPYPGIGKDAILIGFVKHILDGSPSDITTQEVLDVMSISLAVEKSLQTQSVEPVHYYRIHPCR